MPTQSYRVGRKKLVSTRRIPPPIYWVGGWAKFDRRVSPESTLRGIPSSLIMGLMEWDIADDNIRSESQVFPTADLGNSALPHLAKSTIWKCARDHAGTPERRASALRALNSTTEQLPPRRKRRTSALHERPPAAATNFPLIFLFCVALKYTDTEFATDLSRGIPFAGPIAPTPGLAARQKVAEMSHHGPGVGKWYTRAEFCLLRARSAIAKIRDGRSFLWKTLLGIEAV